MTDEELADLEAELLARLNQHAQLAREATELVERIMAERERRQASATVHELRP